MALQLAPDLSCKGTSRISPPKNCHSSPTHSRKMTRFCGLRIPSNQPQNSKKNNNHNITTSNGPSVFPSFGNHIVMDIKEDLSVPPTAQLDRRLNLTPTEATRPSSNHGVS